eukprot:gene1540-12666_t
MFEVPDEILVECFSFLSPSKIYKNGSLVSKRWMNVLQKDCVWNFWYIKTFRTEIQKNNEYTLTNKEIYKNNLKIYYKCQICKNGTPKERISNELILPCECNYFCHSNCIIKKKFNFCGKCHSTYESKFSFSISTFSLILSYIVLLGGTQAIIAISPFILGCINLKKKKFSLVLNRKTFNDGYKVLGKLGLLWWSISTIYKFKSLTHSIITLFGSYYMSFSDSKLFGILVVHFFQTNLLKRFKRSLDEKCLHIFYKVKDLKEENEDVFYL